MVGPPLLLTLAFTLFSLRGGGGGGGGQTTTTKPTKPAKLKVGGRTKRQAKAKRIYDRITRVQDDENVILFPTLSHRRSDGASPLAAAGVGVGVGGAEEKGWDVPIHGWVYEPEHSSLRRRAFLRLLRRALDLDREDEANEILARRVRPFLVDNERGKALTIEICPAVGGGGGKDGNDGVEQTKKAARGVKRRMPRSHRNGHFRGTLHVTDDELRALGYQIDNGNDGSSSSKRLQLRIVQPSDCTRIFTTQTHLLKDTGLSIISDIDDTIKLSNVLDKGALMRNTFLEEFKAVPGMADLYKKWEKSMPDASFHFVSSSPWQLYTELADFMQRSSFPNGSFHLRSVRIKDKTVLNLLADPYETKVSTIASIMDSYPQRMFVLVGDTGEKDPEVYGEICRRYGGRVWRVYLRNVTGEQDDGDGDGPTSSSSRLEWAFRGVPEGVWSVFGDASEVVLPPLPSVVEKAVQ